MNDKHTYPINQNADPRGLAEIIDSIDDMKAQSLFLSDFFFALSEANETASLSQPSCGHLMGVTRDMGQELATISTELDNLRTQEEQA